MFPLFQWTSGDSETGGQVPAVWPSSPGPGQGHHDLHATNQVHVLQPCLQWASQQETESELRYVIFLVKCPVLLTL